MASFLFRSSSSPVPSFVTSDEPSGHLTRTTDRHLEEGGEGEPHVLTLSHDNKTSNEQHFPLDGSCCRPTDRPTTT